MFDFNKFLIERFGHPEAVIGLVRAYGMNPPKYEAVVKWFRRSAVPSAWFPTLVIIAELETGAPIRLANYLKGNHDSA